MKRKLLLFINYICHAVILGLIIHFLDGAVDSYNNPALTPKAYVLTVAIMGIVTAAKIWFSSRHIREINKMLRV